MAKQLNVNMAFTANTSQAKQQIQELQRSLSNLYTSTAKDPTLSMREGVQAALTDVAKLKIALEQATNVKTGNLDLSQFSIQLQKSQLDMTKLSNSFINLGEQGQQAFMQLAQSIVAAETPMRQTNALLGTMWTTIKNVARFQISSSLIHGFIGGIQTAHNYAKDLNQSLNNIRIVTGQSTEQMAKFAEQANKTARALSATTLDYTNASLIYYQQGLDDAAVAERTATTIKLANVSHQSAQEVSDQMTAIWNNFDDGSRSLEYYADVITALGAATASSSAEIAGGLEKFASVAETVGLSYEYATTALATIVATTRQSEDTVGTGLRTIFSRLQGLSLGETLEDGTTLTKYSKALATIGVNIKDQNGELKEMDQILNEIGAKWETLTKDQQVALAQTVGGVRQYTNLVALFDNWDQFQKNLTVATGAEGTLQAQADIYAESWEGARDRVKAAAEKIYSDLLDEDFFISLNKGIEIVLVGLDKLINSIGGIPGVLSLVATAMMTAFGPQISAAINQLVQNIQIMRGTAEQKSIAVKEATIAAMRSFNQGFTEQNEFDRTNSSAVLGGEVTERQIQRTIDLQRQVSLLSEEERKYRQELIELETQYGKNAIAAKKAAEASQAKISDLNRINRLNIRDKQGTTAEAEYTAMTSGLEKWVKETLKANPKFEDFDKLLQEHAISLRSEQKELQISSNQIYKLGQAYAANARDTQVAEQALHNYDARIKETDSLMSMSIAKVQSFGEKFVQIGRTLGQVSMAISSIKGLFNTLSNSNASGLDKITAVLTTIAMTAPLAASVLAKLTAATNAYFAANMNFIIAQALVTAGIDKNTASIAGNIIAKNASAFSSAALATAEGRENAEKLLSTGIKDKDTVATIINAVAEGKLTQATLMHTAAMIKQKLAFLASHPIILIIIAAIAALTAIIYGVVKAINAEAEAMKASNEAVAHAAEAYEEAKKAHEDFKNSLSDYTEAINNIDSLVKGTEEYTAAVQTANNAARKLIDTYDELQGKYHYNAETGAIEFDAGALEELEKIQTNQLNAATEAYLSTKNSNLQLKNDQAIAKTARKDDTKDYLNGIGKSMQTAIVTTLLNPLLGIFVGIPAILNASLGGITKNIDKNRDQRAALEAFGEATAKYGDITLKSAKEMGLISESQYELINSLGLTESELHNLAVELNANTAAILQNSKQIIDNNLNNNDIYKNSKNKDALNTLLAKDYQEETEKIYAEKYKDKFGGMSDKKVQQLYAAQMGYTWSKNKGKNLGEYIDQSGNTVTVSDETARRYLASQEALGSLTNSVEVASGAIDNLAERTDVSGQALYSMVIKGNLSDVNIVSDSNKNKTYTKEELQGSLSDAEFKEIYSALGYKTADEFVKAFNTEMSSQLVTVSDVVKTINLSDSVKEALGTQLDEIIAGMSAGGAQNFAMGINKLIDSFGETVGTEFIDLFSNITKNLSEEEKDIFLKEFGKISDISDSEQWDSFLDSIKNTGKFSEESTRSLEMYVKAAKDVANATKKINFEEFRKEMESLSDLISKIKSGTTDFSEEEYNTLIANGASKSDFARMIDGTYRFIGSIKDLSNVLETSAKSNFTDITNNLHELSEACDQASSNASNAIVGLRNMSKESQKNTTELTETQKFILLISDIWHSFIERLKRGIENIAALISKIIQKIRDGIDLLVEKIASALKQFYDKIVSFINQLIDIYNNILKKINPILEKITGKSAEDLTLSHVESWDEKVEQANARRQTEASAKAHQNFMDSADETIAAVETSGTSLSNEERAAELQWIDDEIEKRRERIEEATTNLAREGLSKEEQEYWENESKWADEEIAKLEEVKEAYQKSGEAAGWLKDLGFDYNEIKEYADYLEKTGKAAGLTQEELLKLATKQKMLERGLHSLNDNAEDFYELLDSGKIDTAEFTDSLKDMQDAVVDIVGGPDSNLDGSIFDAEFFDKNRKEIEAAAKGDLEAIEAVQTAAAKKIVSKMELEGPAKEKVNKVIDDMQAVIPDDIKIGTSIGDIEGIDPFLSALQGLVYEAGMTESQVNELLSSIGFDPVVTYKTMTVQAIGEAKVDGSHDVTLTDPDGNVVHMTLSGDAVEGANLGSQISLPVINSKATKSTGTGGGGGSSGGGGGGSSSKKDKPAPDRSSRYHRITKKQDNNSRALSKAADAKDRYAGRAKLDNLNKEIDLTKEAIALDKERLAEAQQWLEIDRKDLDDALKDVGLAAQIGPDNVIENYQQLFDDLLIQEQNLVDQYNQGLIDDDKYDEEKDKIDAAKEAMDNWEETIEEIQNTEDDLLDKTNEYFDLILSIATTKLELNLEVNDQDLELLDHLINQLEDDAYKSAEAIALMGDKMGRELERATYYQNAINETLGAYGIYSMEQLASMSPEELKNLGITSDTIDNLKDWNSELLSITETLDDLRDEIVNRVIDGFDTLQDKVQESYDYFSHWNTVLEDYRDIVDLNMGALGGKESRALIKQIDDSLLKNSTNALRSSKQMYDTLVESRTEAQKKLEEAMAAGRIGDIKHYEDVLADIDGKIKESQEQWLSDWSDGLQKAQDILTRAVEDAVAEYDKLLSPVYGSLDYLNEAYDRGKEVDEDYVQDYEKLYQLNKLNRDLTKVLNDTDGVKNREQLIKLQEKINKLQKDKTKMSEYDLEVLRKEFEVQQARIALEEAANAKSTVRLQRDNEGNWGYVYTSDFEATEELQQSYEDKLHEYQQLNDEYMSEMSDKLMDLSQNARDRISEIWSDATLTQEEKEARIAEVMKWFNAQRNYIEEQMGHAIDNQAALTDRFYATYQNMQAEVRDTFAETVLSQTMNIEQLNEVTGLLTTGVASLVEAGRLASLEYLASMEEINEAAGTTMDELAGNISSAVDQITIASDANVDTITELSETVQTELLNSLDAAIEAEEKFAQQIAETTANVEAQTAALADALRILNDYSGVLSSSEIGNPLDTLSQSEEKYGIDQPAYNENDWVLNKELGEIFDAVYDEIKSDASHSDFLEMYGAMNDWLTLLQTQAGSAMQGFGSIMSPYYQTPESETLEQQVHIEANFPGVTNSSEIEEAFENLVNKAAQFANRKRQG